MKKLILSLAVIIASLTTSSYAIDLKGILGNLGNLDNVGDVVSGVVDGLLTRSDISVADMAGTWTSTGSAVTFLSDNYLKKAGGSAVASTIESKLDPYYQKYGLIGSTLTIDSSGKFTLKVKGISLNGTITKRSDGNFDFAFTPFGSMKLGSIKAYVEKPISGLNVMFDASKLKSLLSTVAGLTGNSLASTAGNLLDSYDGLCVGFSFKGNGTSTTTNSTNNNQSTTKESVINKAGSTLKGILGF